MRRLSAIMRLLLFWAALSAGLGAAASAQSPMRFTVGDITTKQDCKYFMESEYRHADVATPWLYASKTSWRSWLVKDCVTQFDTMRHSLEAALAATGKFVVGPGGYRVNVTINDVSGGGPAPDVPAVGDRGYAFSKAGIMTSYSVTVTDRAGHVIYGGLGTKTVETGSKINADGTYSWTNMGGDAIYGVLQTELALAIARSVAFKIVPLTVTEVDGGRIGLNYGAPLLKLGSSISVNGSNGLRTVRFLVVSAQNGTAIAEVDGDVDTSAIRPGAEATFAEDDDPAANGRRYDRVRLP